MQESLSEITNARLPLVVFNMARGQGDYFQATRGGGHGDYRHIVLAPMDVPEAVELTRRAFDLAGQWRTPGDGAGRLLLGPHLPGRVGAPCDYSGPCGTRLGAQRVVRRLGGGQDHLPAGRWR